MTISTKKGDKGTTSLYRGGRVSKDNIRIEACGTMDELSSFLGLAKSIAKARRVKKVINLIQQDLVLIGTEIATKPKFTPKLKEKISKDHIDRLEVAIDRLEKKINFDKNCFSVPGDNVTSSTLDISRTIARRLERNTTTLKKKNMLKNRYILVYLNRLSDLLYLLARSFE